MTLAEKVARRYVRQAAKKMPQTVNVGYNRGGGVVDMPDWMAEELAAAIPRSFPITKAHRSAKGSDWLGWSRRSDKAVKAARIWMRKNYPQVKMYDPMDYYTSPESETYWAT